jgi:hypothetical protein
MIKKTVFLFLVTFFAFNVQAQRKTEIGLTGGAIGFFPSYYEHLAYGELSMDFGMGWSAGAFVEQHWKPRIHQVIELNFYSLNSKVEFYKSSGQTSTGYGYNDINIYSQNESFPQIALSGGVKFFVSDHFFLYPGFEFSRALNSNVDMNKTSYNLKLAAGFKISKVDIMLEYCHGLTRQGVVYSEYPLLIGNHLYRYLQLKVQIPIYQFKL